MRGAGWSEPRTTPPGPGGTRTGAALRRPRRRSATPRRGCAVPPSGGSVPSSHRPRLAGLSNMEERERGARSAGAGSPARPPSPRLDVSSDSFDPLLALYAPRLPPIPYPNAPCFNNVAEYESFLRTGVRGGGRGRGRARGAAAGSGVPAAPGPSGRTRRRPDAPAPDPERIQRLRRLMVAKEEGDGAAGAGRRGPGRSRKAPRNVLTRMPCESAGRAGSGAAAVRKLAAEGASAGRRWPGAGLHVLRERLGENLRGSSVTMGWICLSNVGNEGLGRVTLSKKRGCRSNRGRVVRL